MQNFKQITSLMRIIRVNLGAVLALAALIALLAGAPVQAEASQEMDIGERRGRHQITMTSSLSTEDYATKSAEASTASSVEDYWTYLPLVVRHYPDVEIGVLKVARSGDDYPGCGSSAAPCRTIQYAVNLAESGNTVKVAEGTYTYSSNVPHSDCSLLTTRPPAVCVLNKHITLLGGYSTQNWAVADPDRNPTVIDGEDRYRGVTVVGWSKTEPQAILDMAGFTIRRGLAQGGAAGANSDIHGYGGGLFAYKAQVNLEDITFISNRAVGGDTTQTYGGYGVGGGLAIDTVPSGAVSRLRNVVFNENEARGGNGRDRGGAALGGGLSIYDAVVDADHVALANNIAAGGNSNGSGWDTVYGITADALGGGVAINEHAEVTLQHLTATGNQAIGGNAGTQGSDDRGGAAHGGAVFAERAALTVLDADIRKNLVHSGDATNSYVAGGGGLMGINSSVNVRRSTIIQNTACGGDGTTGNGGSAGGGGIYLACFDTDSKASVVNSIIADNYVEIGSGGDPGGGGGGMWLQGVSIDVIHSTIAGNRLGPDVFYGQGMLFLNQGAPTPTTANVSYTIIAGHTNDHPHMHALHAFPGNVVNLNGGLFANNNDDISGEGTFNGLDTMHSATTAGFEAPGSPDYDYHITRSSAAINQAWDSATPGDIDGQSRPQGNGSDIGADEYVP